FLSGTRDPFGSPEELDTLVHRLPAATLHLVDGGDHSLAAPRKVDPAGSSLDRAIDLAAQWILATARHAPRPARLGSPRPSRSPRCDTSPASRRSIIHMLTIILLVISNTFMTFAWYGHLRYRSAPIVAAVLASWLIALGEYCFQVPANRIGYGTFTG